MCALVIEPGQVQKLDVDIGCVSLGVLQTFPDAAGPLSIGRHLTAQAIENENFALASGHLRLGRESRVAPRHRAFVLRKQQCADQWQAQGQGQNACPRSAGCKSHCCSQSRWLKLDYNSVTDQRSAIKATGQFSNPLHVVDPAGSSYPLQIASVSPFP